MDRSPTQDDSHPGRTGINLRDHLCLLVGGSAHHKNNDILGLIADMPPALQEWILQFF